MSSGGTATAVMEEVPVAQRRATHPCAGCRAIVRWIVALDARQRPVTSTVIAIEPDPDPEGDVVLTGPVTGRILAGTDVRPEGPLWRRHARTCTASPRTRRRRRHTDPTACESCGLRLDAVLIGLGDATHPTCGPTGAEP